MQRTSCCDSAARGPVVVTWRFDRPARRRRPMALPQPPLVRHQRRGETVEAPNDDGVAEGLFYCHRTTAPWEVPTADRIRTTAPWGIVEVLKDDGTVGGESKRHGTAMPQVDC